MQRVRVRLLGLLCLLSAGCADLPVAPTHTIQVRTRSARDVDVSPTAYGIFVANAAPADCWGSTHDVDHDWFDDDCEYALASAFAPAPYLSTTEQCQDGQPYWAVKPFAPDRVRIAYMPAYFDDCGSAAPYPWGTNPGHTGASEFIMVEIAYNWSTH